MHNYVVVIVLAGMQDHFDDPTGQLKKVEQFVRDSVNTTASGWH